MGSGAAPDTVRQFRQHELSRWHEFELSQPRTFSNTSVFWIRKARG